ncbi:glycoside hydrolase family 3 protein [Paenibacillus sp. N1-5-1-14]|uniref:glycoside hydrolase family 3 protein n=1 Tax=Paenibacillus radicibacter TaxID=2972488 RepID=UPI0021593AE5|nr:glycoside hydrolase family 3 protein [Paenibacillus radicibacter]MCR8645973.1 glycoside hydrolase family 3 protein [Paenibacillus radicibacter]
MKATHELTLKEKIGQMLMTGFEGLEPDMNIYDLLQNHYIGGIVLFSRNLDHPEQAFALTQRLQRIAKAATGIPLWIGTDQEGGMVVRLRQGIAQLPAAMAMGAARNPELLYEAARGTAEELKLLGINMNFAPVVDINVNPRNPIIDVRAFGDDTELVSDLGIAAMRGFRDGGIVSAIKHFPGHGDTETDSHAELPVVRHSLERLHTVELVPFHRATSAGAEAIMTAHVGIPLLTGGVPIPATLSRDILSGLLREELGFDGLIITDCMEMNAVTQGIGVGEAVVQAVLAGADLLLVSHTYESQLEAVASLERAVLEGRLTEARIDVSVTRLLRLKERRLGLLRAHSWEETWNLLEHPRTLRRIEQLREASITAISREPDDYRLSPEVDTLVLWPQITAACKSEDEPLYDTTLGSSLRTFISAKLDEIVYGTNPSSEEIDALAAEAEGYGQIIAGIFHTASHPGQTALVRRLLGGGGKVIPVSLRNPVDLAAFPEARSCLACYEHHPDTLLALSRVLMGIVEPTGTLPVTLLKYDLERGVADERRSASTTGSAT